MLAPADPSVHRWYAYPELAAGEETWRRLPDPFGATRAGFSAEADISRKEFGLTWNAALEAGGLLVSDKVKISVEAAMVKQA